MSCVLCRYICNYNIQLTPKEPEAAKVSMTSWPPFGWLVTYPLGWTPERQRRSTNGRLLYPDFPTFHCFLLIAWTTFAHIIRKGPLWRDSCIIMIDCSWDQSCIYEHYTKLRGHISSCHPRCSTHYTFKHFSFHIHSFVYTFIHSSFHKHSFTHTFTHS